MIEFLGFDDESISFKISGAQAMDIAKLVGSPYGYEPNRTEAVVSVTLRGEALTPDFATSKLEGEGGDSDGDWPELFDCSDRTCR